MQHTQGHRGEQFIVLRSVLLILHLRLSDNGKEMFRPVWQQSVY